MPRSPAGPPFPDSPGAWLACFRHRVKYEDGRTLSPEEFGRRIGVSGATVRRWETNQAVPDEVDIARIADVCNLTRMQAAFLSSTFSRTKAMPGPAPEQFKGYMRELLASNPGPAIVYDSLLYARAWNSLVDALSPGLTDRLGERHTVAALLGARTRRAPDDEEAETYVRQALGRFWITTASLSHRREYRKLIAELSREPGFREHWLEFAFGDPDDVIEPLRYADVLFIRDARFRSYQATIHFPPMYYLYEYVPEDEAAHQRIAELCAPDDPPEVLFADRLHWVE